MRLYIVSYDGVEIEEFESMFEAEEFIEYKITN